MYNYVSYLTNSQIILLLQVIIKSHFLRMLVLADNKI
jgi:hypothetical protein